jgi:hypothetical protein
MPSTPRKQKRTLQISRRCRSDCRDYREKGLDEAHEEEEDGYTQKCDDCSDHARRSEPLGITALSKHQTLAVPLSHQGRGESTGKTENQTEEPQRVAMDGRSHWLVWQIGLCRYVLDEHPVGDVVELMRCLYEPRNGPITRVWSQLFAVFNYQG